MALVHLKHCLGVKLVEILLGRRRKIHYYERQLMEQLNELTDIFSVRIRATEDPSFAVQYGQLANAYASLIGPTYAGILHQRISQPYYEEYSSLLSADDVEVILTHFPELQPQLSRCLDLDQNLRVLLRATKTPTLRS